MTVLHVQKNNELDKIMKYPIKSKLEKNYTIHQPIYTTQCHDRKYYWIIHDVSILLSFVKITNLIYKQLFANPPLFKRQNQTKPPPTTRSISMKNIKTRYLSFILLLLVTASSYAQSSHTVSQTGGRDYMIIAGAVARGN